MTRWGTPLAAFVLASLLNVAYWAYEGRAVPLPDAGTAGIASVSFSPYRRGEDPLARVTPTLGEISSDLAALAGRVHGVRTYTSLEGLDAAPRFARALGVKVMQSAWLGRDPNVNDREIRSLIALANGYPDVIDRLVVGNEVLLRRDLTREQLAAYIHRVKAAVKQPVTYADVWEFWLKNPELASAVDFITIHILPYWEDQPVSIDHAIDHVMAVYRKVEATFPGKRIMIGEVGWPSAGRMRDDARPSLVNEARFVRDFVALGLRSGLDYNVVEAFDQPWKRALEGTVGGHWGLLDQERRPKFTLYGPVSDDPNWLWHCALAALFAALACTGVARSAPRVGQFGWLAYAGAAHLFGTFLTLDGALTVTICWTPFGWIAGGLGLAGSLLLAALLLRALGAGLAGRAWPSTPLPAAEEALNLLRGRPLRGPRLGERMLGLLQFGFVVGAAVATVALVVDPRYRDFPSEAFLVPAIGFVALAFLRDRRPPTAALLREEMLLVGLLIAGAAGVLIREGLDNSEAVGWSGTLILLAMPWTLKLAARRRAAEAPIAT